MPKLMQRLGLRERLRETEVIDATTTIVNGAMRPFTISATPEQSDNLTILVVQQLLPAEPAMNKTAEEQVFF